MEPRLLKAIEYDLEAWLETCTPISIRAWLKLSSAGADAGGGLPQAQRMTARLLKVQLKGRLDDLMQPSFMLEIAC